MIKITVAGDFCPNNRVTDIFDKGNYQNVLSIIKPFIESDYSIVNLEAPIVTENAEPIPKWGPNLKCSRAVIDVLKYAGFGCVTLANNHFYDYGENGAKTTLEELRKGEVDYVGAGQNIHEASKTLYKDIKGKTFAFINCCEHEYSIATEKSSGSNPINPVRQYYSITEARKKSDYVLLIVHGGVEMYELPTPRMVELYRFFIDAGADVVINHHQHCYSGYEKYHDKYIFYGLGNFCFDMSGRRNSIWNTGFILNLFFEDNGITKEIVPYTQCDSIPCVDVLDGNDKDEFYHNIQLLNTTISNNESLEKKYSEYVNDTSRIYDVFHPYTNKYLLYLYHRGWLPSFISKKQLRSIENKLVCESHYERLVRTLKDKLQ